MAIKHPQVQPLKRQVTAVLQPRAPQQVAAPTTVTPSLGAQLQATVQTSPAKPIIQKVVRPAASSATIQQATSLDNAVRTIMTSVHTSLPTAQLKITSPFSAPGHQPIRQVTMMTSSMKAPISAVPSLSSIQGSTSCQDLVSSAQVNTVVGAGVAQPQVRSRSRVYGMVDKTSDRFSHIL